MLCHGLHDISVLMKITWKKLSGLKWALALDWKNPLVRWLLRPELEYSASGNKILFPPRSPKPFDNSMSDGSTAGDWADFRFLCALEYVFIYLRVA